MSLTGLPAPGGFVRFGPSGWSVVPTGLRPQTNAETMAKVVDILPQADGSFLVAGDFVSIGGAPIANIARLDGTAWQPVGSGIAEKVGAAVQMAGGDIVVLTLASRLARFDGAQWLTLASPSTLNRRRALTPARDGGFFVGRSTYLAGVTTSHLERWSAQSTLTAPVTLPGSLQVQRITQLRDDSVAITTTAGVLR